MVSKCHTCEAETRPIMRWHILSQSPGPFVWGLKMQPVQRVLQYAALRQTFAEQASLILCVRICQTPCSWHELFMEEQHPTIHFYDKPILAPELARVFQKWERRRFRRSRFRFLTNNTEPVKGTRKMVDLSSLLCQCHLWAMLVARPKKWLLCTCWANPAHSELRKLKRLRKNNS